MTRPYIRAKRQFWGSFMGIEFVLGRFIDIFSGLFSVAGAGGNIVIILGAGVVAIACVIAARAASAARRHSAQSAQLLESVCDLTVEVRQLAAQAERASADAQSNAPDRQQDSSETSRLSNRIQSVRAGEAPFASGAPLAGEKPSVPQQGNSDADEKAGSDDSRDIREPSLTAHGDNAPDNPVSNDHLASAARAASEPSALLRGRIRRR